MSERPFPDETEGKERFKSEFPDKIKGKERFKGLFPYESEGKKKLKGLFPNEAEGIKEDKESFPNKPKGKKKATGRFPDHCGGIFQQKRQTKMKDKSKYFQPYVTLVQAFAYDESRPETATASPLVNAVMEAFHTLRPLTLKRVSETLGLTTAKISAALEVATGHGLQDLKEQWVLYRIHQLRTERPSISAENLAREVGFANSSALWKVFHRDRRKKDYADQKRSFEAYMHMTPEQQTAHIEEMHRMVEEDHRRLMESREKAEKFRNP